MISFPFHKQHDTMDCGPTCLRMIAEHYGKTYSLTYLREQTYADKEGVSLLGIATAAEHIGMQTMAVRMAYDTQSEEEACMLNVPLPCIVHWEENHFIVVYKVSKKSVWIADPAKGKLKLSRKIFETGWLSGQADGLALLVEPSPEFYQQEGVALDKSSFGFLWQYIKPYRRLIIQLIFGLLLGSIFQLLFPFLTQSLVDVGIENQDINFVYLILAAQLMLFFSQTIVSFIQSWILLHIGTRVNVSLLSDFLSKLMKLPVGFFDTKMIGDLLQRIGDHRRVETFLTNATLTTIFSVFNLIVFSIVLLIYNTKVFLVFLVASLLYIAWIFLWLRKRKKIDYEQFKQLSDNQSTIIELIEGMREIKLQGSEHKRRWQWTGIQAKLFKVNMRALAISQYQDAGAGFINQFKDIIISFVAAKAVIDGQMTLGMMLAVQYIVGAMNAPLQRLIFFIRAAQDAQISLERLNEIHVQDNEVNTEQQAVLDSIEGAIHIENLSFKYNPLSEWVLRDINLIIPEGKITAIVGKSGSGKTSLVKLLLGFYQATEGAIKINDTNLQNISQKQWRQAVGAVMQDGYIFSDTIANNIAESDETVNKKALVDAVRAANIEDFINELPLGYNTMIGAKGNNVSQGQRQRLLIARAVYKSPKFLFLDEATNALDTENEKIIIQNMDAFFQNRTVIVVAHRLSTVKNADQIILLDQGRLVEQGTHESLVSQKGAYYQLVKNQLELD